MAAEPGRIKQCSPVVWALLASGKKMIWRDLAVRPRGHSSGCWVVCCTTMLCCADHDVEPDEPDVHMAMCDR